MRHLTRRSKIIAALLLAFATGSCSRAPSEAPKLLPTSMSEIPAARLNYRYEADVPQPPPVQSSSANAPNAAIQSDFDQNRPQEILDRTVQSPDGKRVLAVYHRAGDLAGEFRLDMYASDGRPLRRITADAMAVHFAETILWSPDSQNAAFVAMLRAARTSAEQQEPTPSSLDVPPAAEQPSGSSSNAESSPMPTQTALPSPASNVLTFRTEQLYIAGADGDNVKPLTQNEGLIYYYFAWAPDSSALAAMATTAREWQLAQASADSRGEIFVPMGRPRIVEKNGRERRLDDNLTAVQPVWSPDSTKVALGYDKQLRIYDAAGNAPTQAAIPLRNSLLISSAAYDREQAKTIGGESSAGDANASPSPYATTTPESAATLPDETTLVSFNPIVALAWPSDDTLYFQTAYVKRMKNEADSVTSFSRWHRIIFTPQPMGK